MHKRLMVPAGLLPLALGVTSSLAAPKAGHTGSAAPQTQASEATLNPSCPAVGTHGQNQPYSATSDGGLRNLAKRHIPSGESPAALTLADFSALQQDINSAFADADVQKTTFEPSRNALRNLATTAGKVSEGDLVQLTGYLTVARDEGKESVNCGGSDGRDIHINVSEKGGTEYQGVVVEMIPQLPRPIGWDSGTLNTIAKQQLPVLVVGGLTYDNEHYVNKDSQHPKSGQPARMSLWEIHPITEFYVCTKSGGCDPSRADTWVSLEEWANAKP